MSKRHYMVDLETLGRQDGAALLSIGVVEMDFDNHCVGKKMEVIVDPMTCAAYKMHVDAGTVLWWFAQSGEARARIVDDKGAPLGVTIQSALCMVSDFMDPEQDGNAVVWGNGATFDNVILRGAYNRVDIIPPWEFWNDRCYRTMKSLYKDVPFVKPALAHSAVDDAEAQAVHLMKIARVHNLNMG